MDEHAHMDASSTGDLPSQDSNAFVKTALHFWVPALEGLANLRQKLKPVMPFSEMTF
jgi:hypothetical protein